MSSLAASRADGFYYPPEYDPDKHGSLNQFRGQHPLRERAKKLDQGILVIRFEMPFNVWCAGCNHLIGKGVRFNAEKKQIGSYYSTKIWSFTMRAPCCGQEIEVQTDPKNTEYNVVRGGRRKAETWTAENAETIELPDRDDETAAAALHDPFAKLERGETDKRRGRELGTRIAELYHDSNLKFKDDFALNRTLRKHNRTHRKQEKERDVKRKALGLSDDVRLLPEAEEDAFAASLVQFGDADAFAKKWRHKRRAIKRQSIFTPTALTPAAARETKPAAGAAEPIQAGRSSREEQDTGAAAASRGVDGSGKESSESRTDRLQSMRPPLPRPSGKAGKVRASLLGGRGLGPVRQIQKRSLGDKAAAAARRRHDAPAMKFQ